MGWSHWCESKRFVNDPNLLTTTMLAAAIMEKMRSHLAYMAFKYKKNVLLKQPAAGTTFAYILKKRKTGSKQIS